MNPGYDITMETLILFKIAQALVVVMLLFFVFDVRLRGERHLRSNVPLFIAVLFPLYASGYLAIIFFFLGSATLFDWLAFLISFAGLMLVAKARIDLKGWYAWPGQFRVDMQLVRTGIYSYMRHPIYVGTFVFVMGTLLTVVVHSPLILGILMAVTAATLLAFITLAARCEEARMQEELGEVYISYQCEVNAVLPFKRPLSRSGKQDEDQ